MQCNLNAMVLKWLIESHHDDEFAMANCLAAAVPELKWDEGDSSWDKVRVWGESREGAASPHVRVSRYEAPGPFELFVRAENEEACLALRDRVITALGGRLHKAS